MTAGKERSGVCTEQKGGGTGRFRGKIRNPKAGPDVPRVANDGIEMTRAYQLPQARIVKAEEGFGARSLIGNMGPRVAVEERHIPLYGAAEFRVVACFGTPQAAIGHMGIEPGMLRH